MKMDGEYTLPTNVENVWNKLNDPLVLKNSIPGCTELIKKMIMNSKLQSQLK